VSRVVYTLALALLLTRPAPAEDWVAVELTATCAAAMPEAFRPPSSGVGRELEAFWWCWQVAVEAERQGAPVVTVVAIAAKESGFRNVRGSSGEIGPLQIIPEYTGEEHGTAQHGIPAAVALIRALLDEHSAVQALGRYHRGPRRLDARGARYATRVLDIEARIRYRLDWQAP